MSKKSRSKGAAGPDPSHQAYLTALKGIQSSLLDIDIIETEYWLFALCAEENGQVTVYAIDQDTPETKPRVISRNYKFDGGMKLTSASFSLIKAQGEASQNISIA